MDIDIVINPAADTPIYQQLYDRISAMIMGGELSGDDALPPIRTVAKELGISVIPVKRAWEELEHSGLIYTVTGKGCFVAPLKRKTLLSKRNDAIGERLRRELGHYKALGLSVDEYIEMVKKYYR